MTFEQKIALLACSDGKKRAELLAKWEKTDDEIYYAFHGKDLPMEEFMKQERYKRDATAAKSDIKNLDNKGWTKDKHMKLLAQIPAHIYFTRPEFSPYLDPKEREANIRKFLAQYPAFKV
jgi:hypothetical protein